MPTDYSVQLKSLVFAAAPAQQEALAGELESSPYLECTDAPSDLTELRDCLLAQDYDLAIIAVEHSTERLPACLLRYPDLQVLVVTAGRKTGSVESWRQQGANDVVSSLRPGKLQLAMERMLDTCLTRAQLRMANLKLAAQDKLNKKLLDTQAEALLLWQDGQVLESNGCLDYLIGCSEHEAQGADWQSWLTTESYTEMHHPLQTLNKDVTITSVFGQKYQARIECLMLDHGSAKLIRINPRPIDASKWRDEQNDSVTGVLRRDSFLEQFESWLRLSTLPRYTVVQISIDVPDTLSMTSSSDSTLQELLVYRAANMLQQQFQDDMMIGRTGLLALTLVSRQSIEDSRNLALQLRRCLGSVGDLVEDPQHIKIKTLTLAPSALTAAKVLHRLELRPLVTQKAQRRKTPRSDSVASGLSA